VPNTELNKHNY